MELTKLTAAELAGAIKSGQASAVEVAQAHLDRIADVDPAVHAFLHVDADGALAAAAAVDASPVEHRGPLAGVPLALKDVLTMKGVPTTCGSRILAGWRPAVQRHGHATSERRRSGDPRQDQHGRVRDGLVDGELRLRADPQSLGPRANPRRLLRWIERRRGGVRSSPRHRHGYRRLDSSAGSRYRHRGHEADVWRGVALRLVAFSSSLDQAGPFARTVLDAAMLHEDRRQGPDGRHVDRRPRARRGGRRQGRARLASPGSASAWSSSYRARGMSLASSHDSTKP